ncbi:hypothetical protein ACH5Y9_10815 [Methylomonas sp. BW4-1]|uniref:hypothetical protein n=1 Tax=Methylomonas sp. BW4-1 TaxID=3376685 RepID=UPI004042E52C
MEYTDNHIKNLKDEWSLKERRIILRELLIHEDSLSISRSQALYTIQGFLFASLGLLTNKGNLPQWTLKSIIMLVSLVGISAAVSYFRELKKNTSAINHIVSEWKQLTKDIPNAPQIIGYVKKESFISNEMQYESPIRLPRETMPIVFFVVWTLVIVLTLTVPL